jgi:nanoRNase/pAp phosphatase (c-di-AMP/oligoRNAs hydrolase)
MDQDKKPEKTTSQSSQIAELLKKSNNILITISKNPSVDQLSACLGLTLALNKADKHASAVFSV